MEGAPRTHESDVMHFCVIAIETAAKKMNIAPNVLVQRLEKHNLIESRLFRFYSASMTLSTPKVRITLLTTLSRPCRITKLNRTIFDYEDENRFLTFISRFNL